MVFEKNVIFYALSNCFLDSDGNFCNNENHHATVFPAIEKNHTKQINIIKVADRAMIFPAAVKDQEQDNNRPRVLIQVEDRVGDIPALIQFLVLDKVLRDHQLAVR